MPRRLRRLLRRLREEGLSPDGKKQLNDVLSDAIYWVAKAILDDDPKARKSAAARARQFRAHNERDRQRVEAFVSLALARNPN